MKWEYDYSIVLNSYPQVELLNKMGKDGWELVCVVLHDSYAYIYWKRQIN